MKNKMKIFFTSLFLLASSVYIFAQGSFGGDSATAGTEATAEKVQKVAEVSAFSFLMKGGVFLIPIILLLFYTLYVIIERSLYLRRVTKFDSKIMDSIRPHMLKLNFKDALGTIQSNDTAYGNVLKEGLACIDSDKKVSEVESNMDKVANIEIGKMEKNMGSLGLIAGIAPTVGFIGTISGVIKIFYSISITENVSIGNISGGLYEKMISSGAGLIVGIIGYAGYHILNAVIDAYALRIQQVNLEFIKSTQP